ncbi:hypothetical protein LBMAG53_25350 [Planctomycetota bacterium]|nr:hypothetical protein LBMAG53_25350 [Planctomycetota bacterium]
MITIHSITKKSDSDFIVLIEVNGNIHETVIKKDRKYSASMEESWFAVFLSICNVIGPFNKDLWGFIGGERMTFPIKYESRIPGTETSLFLDMKSGLEYKAMLKKYRGRI